MGRMAPVGTCKSANVGHTSSCQKNVADKQLSILLDLCCRFLPTLSFNLERRCQLSCSRKTQFCQSSLLFQLLLIVFCLGKFITKI